MIHIIYRDNWINRINIVIIYESKITMTVKRDMLSKEALTTTNGKNDPFIFSLVPVTILQYIDNAVHHVDFKHIFIRP